MDKIPLFLFSEVRLLLGIAVGMTAVSGCERAPVKSSAVSKHPDQVAAEVNARQNELYQIYLNGNRNDAARSVENVVKLLEETEGQPPRFQAANLWPAYARLHLLEQRNGDEALAEAFWTKARYWYLRTQELSGSSKADAARAVEQFTATKCAELLNRLDGSKANGRGPAFLRTANSTQPAMYHAPK